MSMDTTESMMEILKCKNAELNSRIAFLESQNAALESVTKHMQTQLDDEFNAGYKKGCYESEKKLAALRQENQNLRMSLKDSDAQIDGAFTEGYFKGVQESESYKKGHDDGYKEGCADTEDFAREQCQKAIDEGYKKGYADGYKQGYNECDRDAEVINEMLSSAGPAYYEGLEDAWNVARKIVANYYADTDNAYMAKIFGDIEIEEIFFRNSAEDAIRKFQEYDNANLIAVGDEVCGDINRLYLVTHVEGERLLCVEKGSGIPRSYLKKAVRKTGNYYPEIAVIFNAGGENT